MASTWTPPPYTLRKISAFNKDLAITSPTHRGTTVYHLSHRSWTSGPTLILHAGADASAPRVAAYKFHSFSRNEVCLGDCERSPQWTPLDIGGGLFSGEGSRKYTTFRAPDTGHGFRLESSRDESYGLSSGFGFGGDKRGFLLKAEDGTVVAVFRVLSYRGSEKCSFEWRSGVTKGEEVVCLMVMCSIFEAGKRSKSSSNAAVAGSAAAAGAGAGGGGGGA